MLSVTSSEALSTLELGISVVWMSRASGWTSRGDGAASWRLAAYQALLFLLSSSLPARGPPRILVLFFPPSPIFFRLSSFDDDEFENPAAFPVEALVLPVPGAEEGVLADDLEAEDGDEVDELFSVGGRARGDAGGGGAETEVEDNGGAGLGAGMVHPSHNAMDEDALLPPLPDDVEMELDAESGEGSGSGEGGVRRVSGDGTLGAKRKR
ncbi:hypothetical protein B0H17DRAFT_1203230 [Mycena rosella]|uniref:Uncharacterized protein n=1 Tax=Mycena rosella TaxID=1033263 RepID=A0AAD7DCE4_MYCRO|nr:hypothetical protein B0H17DRAFT_1203230 [Mycena rosella]